MKVPQYVTDEEVRRVCRDLGITDWTTLERPEVAPEEAKAVLAELGIETMGIDDEEFRVAIEVELEHGKRFPEANVTNNHPILTGLIVLAHLKESLDYYKFLEVAEIEGDMVKAALAEDSARMDALYRKLAAAKLNLAQAVLRRMS